MKHLFLNTLVCVAATASLTSAQEWTIGPRHEGAAMSASYSPDGSLILSAGADKTLRLWDAKTGRPVGEFTGHKSRVFAAAFSPDGSMVASGGADASPKVWNVQDRALITSLKSAWNGHNLPITAVAWSPDGTLLLTGGVDPSVKVWDVGRGKVVKTLDGHDARVDSDRTTGTLCSWVAKECAKKIKGLSCIPAHEECHLGNMAIAVTPDGKRALTGGGNGSIKVWSLPEGKKLAEWPGNGDPVLSLAVSPDGKRVLSGTTGNTVTLWDLETGDIESGWAGHTDDVTCLAFSPDGKTALSGSRDATVILWSVESGRNIRSWTDHSQEVRSVAFSPDGRRVLSAGMDGTLLAWDLLPAAAAAEEPIAKVEPEPAAVVAEKEPEVLPESESEPDPILTLPKKPVVVAEKREPVVPELPAPLSPVLKQMFSSTPRSGVFEPRSLAPAAAAPAAPEKRAIAVAEKPAEPAESPVFEKPAPPEPRAVAVAEKPAPAPVKAPEPAVKAPEPAVKAPEPAPLPALKPSGPAVSRLAPAELSCEVAFVEPSGNDALDGGEKAVLRVVVSNNGAGPGMDLQLTVKPSSALLKAPAKVALGALAPGTSTTMDVPLEALDDVETGQAKVELGVEEASGFDADPVVLELDTRAAKLPRLELAAVTLGGGGIVRLAQIMPMELVVKNSGTAPALDASATLVVSDPDIVISGDTTVALGTLEPGQSRSANFEFFVKKRYKGAKALPMSLSAAESTGRRGLTEAPLGLAMNKTAPSMRIVSVKGKALALPETEAAFEDVDTPPETPAPVDPDAFGVVIGIERYRQEGIPAVDFAARDAQSVYNYLTKSMGFDPKNVALLQNDRASRSDLVKYLGSWLKNRVTSEKQKVFIFYAGHGSPDPTGHETFLIPFDGDPNYAEDTAFPVKQLYTQLAKLPTKDVTVALDACFSGAGGRSVIAKGARPLVTTTRPPDTGENTVVLSATSADQISTFYPDGQHGLMTYFLLKALKGAADADKDGRITTSEVYAYMRDPVEREARKQNIEQMPSLSPAPSMIGEKGNKVWLRLR